MRRLATFVAAGVAAVIVSASPALATDITNPADHPFPITVTVYGQTYHDGQDTLPGYDDYACTAIPGVEYDFAHNEIDYPGGKTATWTEWDRIPGYDVWLQQQKKTAQTKPATGSGSASSASSGSSSSGSSSSGPSSSSGSSTQPSSSSTAGSSQPSSAALTSAGAKASGSFVVGSSKTNKGAKVNVTKVSGAFTVKPTTRKAGKYTVMVATPSGRAKATGTVTVQVKKGATVKTLKGSLSSGLLVASVPKLAKGKWSIAIAWPGDAHYRAASATGSLAVTR